MLFEKLKVWEIIVVVEVDAVFAVVEVDAVVVVVEVDAVVVVEVDDVVVVIEVDGVVVVVEVDGGVVVEVIAFEVVASMKGSNVWVVIVVGTLVFSVEVEALTVLDLSGVSFEEWKLKEWSLMMNLISKSYYLISYPTRSLDCKFEGELYVN